MSDEQPAAETPKQVLEYVSAQRTKIVTAVGLGDRAVRFVIGQIVWLIFMVPVDAAFASNARNPAGKAILYLIVLIWPSLFAFQLGVRCLIVAGVNWRTVPGLVGTVVGGGAIGLLCYACIERF